MKPLFAVQVTDRHELELHKTIDALKNVGLDYETFGLIAFTDDITNLDAFPTDRPVIPICGTKLLNMYLRGLVPDNWQMFYDRTEFDQSFYSPIYGEYLLNHGAEYWPYWKIADQVLTEARFIKPVDDGKSFAGLIVESGQSLNEALEKQTTQFFDERDMVLVAPVQNLGREWRMFIVDGDIIDISEYRDHGRVKAKETPPEVQDMLRSYYRSNFRHKRKIDSYVMDVAEIFPHSHLATPEESGREFRIVELNCLNCSGAYKIDLEAVYSALAISSGDWL